MAKGVSTKGAVTKVIYKPDSQSTDEFIAYVHLEEYNKWKGADGDKTIPLVDVVETFQIYHSGQGAQGILGKPSKQQLDTVFGTTNDSEVIGIVLDRGTAQAGGDMTEPPRINPARGHGELLDMRN